MGDLAAVDVAVLALLGWAALRGLWNGVIREVFSLAALAGACLAVRFYTVPLSRWLLDASPFELGDLAARVAAGALLAIGVIAAAALIGSILRRGARAAGLGLADRFAGGLLGLGEGALLAGMLLVVALLTLGRDHTLLADARSVAALESFEQLTGLDPSLPDVAAPPR